MLQTSQHWRVQTYAGPKLLQERPFLWRVGRRQDLHSVVTSQLDAHEAKRLMEERRGNEHTCVNTEIHAFKKTVLFIR